ncbi:unnamed protein product [Rotaria magnacalcarata]|uniref:Uncharacterized protein n=1 Tax=Rotaria magnacalcarata TaxID=392030 RepID=A0A816VAQ5_9BILA|nr:unnamed protein product [Rotaria magnacalcarata]
MIGHAKAGFVSCNDRANVRSCSTTTCSIVSYVVKDGTYSSDCYVNGASVNLGTINSKWYRLNLNAGGYGYVSAHYCSGNLYQC